MRDAALETISDFPVTFSIFKKPMCWWLEEFWEIGCVMFASFNPVRYLQYFWPHLSSIINHGG